MTRKPRQEVLPLSSVRPPLLGLVLAGGKSQRMGTDKSQLIYPEISGLTQRDRLLAELGACGIEGFISCRLDQVGNVVRPFLLDQDDFKGGPGVGLLSAHVKFSDCAWLVVACDFPFINQKQISQLVKARTADGNSVATKHADGTIEPLFAIWEPKTLQKFLQAFKNGFKSPQKILLETETIAIQFDDEKTLFNINSVAEADSYDQLKHRLSL